MVVQEFGQALMWLSCALVGWIASSLLLTYLGCRKGSKTIKAKAGSDAFRQEVAVHANKTCASAAARHFGLSETEVQQCCSQFEGQQSSVTVEETPSAPEAPLFTAPSVHPGHVLLEHYDVFNPREGAWSGPLEVQFESTEPVEPPTPKSVPIPLTAFSEINAEEFFEGNESISLWLVPEGHVYDHCAHGWVKNAAST